MFTASPSGVSIHPSDSAFGNVQPIGILTRAEQSEKKPENRDTFRRFAHILSVYQSD